MTGIAGMIGAILLAVIGRRKAAEVVSAIETGVATGGMVKLRLTGYWPFSARPGERKMEGGLHDRKGNPLHSLEDFQTGGAPFVSLSGDDAIWPYGQRIEIAAWPGVVFRYVDTGSHFRGAMKIYRMIGYEPTDVCVASSATKVPKTSTARIIAGDNFERGKAVAVAKLKDQVVVGITEASSESSYVSLARLAG